MKCLEDGVQLCRLAEKIKPGSIKKVNASKLRFKMMENVAYFVEACKTLGVPAQYIFDPTDLCDRKSV